MVLQVIRHYILHQLSSKEVKKTDEENEKHVEEKEKLKDAQNAEDAQVKEEKDADKLLN